MIPINHPALTKYLEGIASKYDEPVLKAMEARSKNKVIGKAPVRLEK